MNQSFEAFYDSKLVELHRDETPLFDALVLPNLSPGAQSCFGKKAKPTKRSRSESPALVEEPTEKRLIKCWTASTSSSSGGGGGEASVPFRLGRQLRLPLPSWQTPRTFDNPGLEPAGG